MKVIYPLNSKFQISKIKIIVIHAKNLFYLDLFRIEINQNRIIYLLLDVLFFNYKINKYV